MKLGNFFKKEHLSLLADLATIAGFILILLDRIN